MMIAVKAITIFTTLAATGTVLYAASSTLAFPSQLNLGQTTDQIRSERRDQVESGFEAALQRAVDRGDLSEEHLDMILDKRDQVKSECDNNGEKMMLHRQDIIDWAMENDIDPSFIMGMGQGQGERQLRGIKGVGRRMHRQR